MIPVTLVPYTVSSFDTNINNDDGERLKPVIFFSHRWQYIA
jgi:hypothetical protein